MALAVAHEAQDAEQDVEDFENVTDQPERPSLRIAKPDSPSANSTRPTNPTTNRSRPYTTPHQTATELGYEQRPPWVRTLSRPSDPHPYLRWLLNDALSAILLCADGGVMQIGAPIRGSGGDSVNLVGGSDLASIIDQLANDFGRSRTDLARLRVIKRAQDQLLALKYAPKLDPKFTKGTREFRQHVAEDPRSCRAVAHAYRISLRDVVAYRREFRR